MPKMGRRSDKRRKNRLCSYIRLFLQLKSISFWDTLFKIIPGSDLIFQGLATQVPSALESLTSVFGMGTGVAFSISPPDMVQVYTLKTI